MANRYLAGIDMNGNIINNARLEQQNSNVNYDNNLHPAGQIVYNPSLQRAVMTTPVSNNNYTNQLAYLSDIRSITDNSGNTIFVNTNFSYIDNTHVRTIDYAFELLVNKAGAIIVYEGDYYLSTNLNNSYGDITILAIGKVTIALERELTWMGSALKMYGNITLNLQSYDLYLTGCNATIEITEIKSESMDGNNVPLNKLINTRNNTNIKLWYLNTNIEYNTDSGNHNWHILEVGRIGSPGILAPYYRFMDGTVTHTHFRFQAKYNFGTYIHATEIDDGMTSQQITKYYDITSNIIYGGQQFAFSQPLAPLGIDVNNIQELTPYYVINNLPRMYGGRNLRAYILNGNLEVQVLDYQGSAIGTVPIGEQALLGAIIRTLE